MISTIMELDEKQIKKLIQDELSTNARKNKYGVTDVPVHTHNSIDSVRVDPNDLIGASSYFAINNTILSTTQILALKDTPIVIVPRQTSGSTTASTSIGSVIIVEGITAKIIYGGTAYTGANALEFRYTGTAGAKVTADMPNTFINTAGNAYAHVAGVTTVLTPVANTPIVVCVPTANPGTGNSTIKISVKYRVIPL